MTDHLRNEWISEALQDADDENAWREAITNEDLGLDVPWVTTDDMHRTWNDDNTPVQALYDPKDYGWWDRESGQ